MQQPKIKAIISGGGTGGHIFPAVAIANALKNLNNENEILFVGALGRMEMEKVPAAGYKIIGLPISGLQRKLSLSNIKIPFRVLKSIWMSKEIIKDFRPDVAIGVGGYASAPLLYAATMQGVPSIIQEQNSYAGITNKILGKRVKRICVAYSGMEKYFPKDKIVLTGNPVRQDIRDIQNKRTEALSFFGLNGGKKTILVIGGSLGARTVNESIKDRLSQFADKDIQVIWQTGKGYHQKALEAASKMSGIKSYDFISRMDLAYSVADIVISRAGALSISELQITGKPSILVPSPNVAEDHQTKNAMALVEKDAAIIIHDKDASAQLVEEAIKLLNDHSTQEKLKANISKMAIADSSERIANEIYSLIRK